MLLLVDASGQSSQQGRIDICSTVCHDTAESQLACCLIGLVRAADAFTAEENTHKLLWISCNS